jgi:hypothetical protein
MTDQEQRAEPLRQRLRELVPSGAGSVGGALVGLAVGGPAGALAGAVAEPALEQLAREALALRRRRGERAYELATAEAGMSPEELLQRILADQRLMDLAVLAVTAASETALDAKIQALGRALATGALATDEAVVDQQRLLVGILADLEAPHLRVLAQLAEPSPDGRMAELPDRMAPRPRWSFDKLAAMLPTMQGVLEPVLRVLEAHGLAGDVGDAISTGINQCWITDAGLLCLGLLAERARGEGT